ncbi:unnamed protein product [Amoebophrya sp. A25]|nr:unnamed protein product [Amoebophrya sp. A25]|eukprot:GSA25T00002545001.1
MDFLLAKEKNEILVDLVDAFGVRGGGGGDEVGDEHERISRNQSSPAQADVILRPQEGWSSPSSSSSTNRSRIGGGSNASSRWTPSDKSALRLALEEIDENPEEDDITLASRIMWRALTGDAEPVPWWIQKDPETRTSSKTNKKDYQKESNLSTSRRSEPSSRPSRRGDSNENTPRSEAFPSSSSTRNTLSSGLPGSSIPFIRLYADDGMQMLNRSANADPYDNIHDPAAIAARAEDVLHILPELYHCEGPDIAVVSRLFGSMSLVDRRCSTGRSEIEQEKSSASELPDADQVQHRVVEQLNATTEARGQAAAEQIQASVVTNKPTTPSASKKLKSLTLKGRSKSSGGRHQQMNPSRVAKVAKKLKSATTARRALVV